jgi:hypothetical protein
MTPENKKKFNVMTGSTFAVLGIVCFIVAAYAASVPAVPKPAPVNPAPVVSASSCRDVLAQMGYTATLSSGGGVTAKDPGAVSDPQGALIKATAAIGICKMALQEFCMGSECADPGIAFTIKSTTGTGKSEKPAETQDTKPPKKD